MKKLTCLTAAALVLAVGMALLLPACAAGEGENAQASAAPAPSPAAPASLSAGFSDVKGDAWYTGAVDYVRENELMDGVGDGHFDPEGTLTRAMLVTVLWRQAGEPVVNYLLQFSDVPEGRWYTEAVRWAAGDGLVAAMATAGLAPATPSPKST